MTGLPPVSYFLTSAVFHYLGPSFAVLLFAHVAVLGVAWLRIAAAAVVFALWRRPWRLLRTLTAAQLRVLLALGAVLAAMNSLFYLAIDRLPLATVGAIEFLGTVVLAAAGARTRRNVLALALVIAGVIALTAVRLAGDALGFIFAFANCAGFMLYVTLGHKIANISADGTRAAPGSMSGIDQLGAAMLVAAVVAIPAGLPAAIPAFTHPRWLLWGIGVGVCSSVIPYVTRPARHGQASARDLRADARPPAGRGSRHRICHPRPGPDPRGLPRHRPRHCRCGPPPEPGRPEPSRLYVVTLATRPFLAAGRRTGKAPDTAASDVAALPS